MKRALILVDHGSTVKEANEMLADVARLAVKSNPAGFEIIRYCHMELAEPTMAQAFDECVAEGATDITVHPYFLAPGRHSTRDIPRMAEEAARRHPGISYKVTEPLGLHEKIIDVIFERAGTRERK